VNKTELQYELNESLGVYVLHTWLLKNNTAGMFEDWNPNVSAVNRELNLQQEHSANHEFAERSL